MTVGLSSNNKGIKIMNKPLLSICIPTYNRCRYLEKSLESIISQTEFSDGKVEIIISDNASDDDTEQISKKYSDKYKNILYFRNKENIYDRNFPIVISRANGILRRLSNDTVMYRDGALGEMCQIIEMYREQHPYIFWSNGSSKTHDKIKETDFSGFMRDISYYITSIACFSIWEDECDRIESDIAKCDLFLWQVRKGLELSAKKNKILIYNKVLTSTQHVENKNISYGLYNVFYQNYFTLLNPYFENGKLTEEDRDFLEKDLLLNFFPEWCVQWKLHNTTLQYSKTEDLCSCIYQEFHEKPYWSEYTKKFNRIYWKSKIKQMIQKIFRRG